MSGLSLGNRRVLDYQFDQTGHEYKANNIRFGREDVQRLDDSINDGSLQNLDKR